MRDPIVEALVERVAALEARLDQLTALTSELAVATLKNIAALRTEGDLLAFVTDADAEDTREHTVDALLHDRDSPLPRKPDAWMGEFGPNDRLAEIAKVVVHASHPDAGKAPYTVPVYIGTPGPDREAKAWEDGSEAGYETGKRDGYEEGRKAGYAAGLADREAAIRREAGLAAVDLMRATLPPRGAMEYTPAQIERALDTVRSRITQEAG